MNINYPRRHINRNASSDSLVLADLSRPRRGNSGDLSLFGESSRDLLDFSRYLEENEADTKSSLRSTRRSKSAEKSSSMYPIGTGSPPAALSRDSSFHADARNTISPSNNGHLKTPRSVEMTNTSNSQSGDDLFVPPFLEEKCIPRCIITHHHRMDNCSPDFHDSSLSCLSSLSDRLQKPPALKKAPTTNLLQKMPAGTASESAARREPKCGIVRRTQSSGDGCSSSSISSSSTNHQKCSAQSLQWDRPMIQIVPGYSLPLAGMQESFAAYQRQAVEETICDACQTELFCIDSASMVLCPVCRSISPIYATNSVNNSEQLGLGLTVESLAEEFSKL